MISLYSMLVPTFLNVRLTPSIKSVYFIIRLQKFILPHPVQFERLWLLMTTSLHNYYPYTLEYWCTSVFSQTSGLPYYTLSYINSRIYTLYSICTLSSSSSSGRSGLFFRPQRSVWNFVVTKLRLTKPVLFTFFFRWSWRDDLSFLDWGMI